MKTFPILRVVAKILLPYIVLFAFYVQFHGDYGPGGGFQAGVILASSIMLYSLIFGLGAARRVLSPVTVEALIATGVLVYAGTGFACVLAGGNFLEYSALEHSFFPNILPHGQHLGIFLVEAGVGVTVAAVMLGVFYVFAGHERTVK